ncbi:MAG: VWA domain-containing protein [Sphingobacteriales bacterium]|nr:VWA domain-containing protein [Sphingobacteriales bacterium]
MELDEYLYGKFVKYFQNKKKISAEIQNRTAVLEELKPRLTILACATTGAHIEIYAAEREGGYKNNNFFLPVSFSKLESLEQNISYYFFRVLYLTIQRKLGFNWSHCDVFSPEESVLKAAEHADQVLSVLFQEYPVTRSMYDKFKERLTAETPGNSVPDYSWLYGKWMKNEQEDTGDKQLKNFTDKIKSAAENNTQTILKAKPVEEVVSIEIDQKQQEDYVLTHNFEKVETAEEFSGVWRDFDGEDELEEHQDALDELNMKYTVRTDDTSHSVYQSDFVENTTVSESGEVSTNAFFISYDEWDFSKRAYKKEFCKLYPKRLRETNVTYYNNTITQNTSVLTGLRKMLTNINNKMQQQKRQTQGNEFDTDSVTDLFVDVHTGHTPSENIYISNRKKEKDISLLLLLDISLSSDGYVNGNRIIDVEKQVAILFGEIIQEFNIDFAIDCFYSKTRNYSTYLTVKGFEDDWNKAKYRIGDITPSGFTRIGTALRHSGALLNNRPSRNKWIILISDGKPNDYDKYEGKYGIRDVRQALHELKQNNINSYALAIEASAKYYLPQMFGQNHYQIVSSPTDLVTSLVRLYEKIKYQT